MMIIHHIRTKHRTSIATLVIHGRECWTMRELEREYVADSEKREKEETRALGWRLFGNSETMRLKMKCTLRMGIVQGNMMINQWIEWGSL